MLRDIEVGIDVYKSRWNTRSRPVLPEVASVEVYEGVTWSNTNIALENTVTNLIHFLNAFMVFSLKVYDFANAETALSNQQCQLPQPMVPKRIPTIQVPTLQMHTHLPMHETASLQ
jgi:hypothetical protein